jgi:hypothetical protein
MRSLFTIIDHGMIYTTVESGPLCVFACIAWLESDEARSVVTARAWIHW